MSMINKFFDCYSVIWMMRFRDIIKLFLVPERYLLYKFVYGIMLFTYNIDNWTFLFNSYYDKSSVKFRSESINKFFNNLGKV